ELLRVRAAQLERRARHLLQELRGAGMAEREQAAVGDERELAADLDPPVHHEVAPFALLAESVRLELADQLERERVVELAHVDVGRREAALRERDLRSAPAAPAVAVPDRRG